MIKKTGKPSAIARRRQAKPLYRAKKPVVKQSSRGKLRIIPLGGMEEVGRNMMVFEYEKDIVIIDMGLQFPEEDMPGIDYIIPNTAYLKDKKENTIEFGKTMEKIILKATDLGWGTC